MFTLLKWPLELRCQMVYQMNCLKLVLKYHRQYVTFFSNENKLSPLQKIFYLQ